MNETRLVLTERAAAHVRKFLARHDNSVGLRVGVKPTGCSGYKYVVEPAGAVMTSWKFVAIGPPCWLKRGAVTAG